MRDFYDVCGGARLNVDKIDYWEQFKKKNFFVGELQWEETLQEVLGIMSKLMEV